MPGAGSNPHAPCGTRDFKSRASASFATPASVIDAEVSILPKRCHRTELSLHPTGAAEHDCVPGQSGDRNVIVETELQQAAGEDLRRPEKRAVVLLTARIGLALKAL